MSRRNVTLADLEREDATRVARDARGRRLYAVQEALEAIGVDVSDLIELIEDRQSRARY